MGIGYLLDKGFRDAEVIARPTERDKVFRDYLLNRRLLIAAPALLLARAAVGKHLLAESEDPTWPSWAPSRKSLYAQFTTLAHGSASDIRSFGAKLDGRTDDTAALERAVAAGTRVLLIPALADGRALRLTHQIQLNAPIWILGAGDKSLIRWEGAEDSAFLARPIEDDPAIFIRDIHIDNIRMVCPHPRDQIPLILTAINIRGVSVTRCSTDHMGTLLVRHMRALLNHYRRKGGSITQDAAVLAGFSATATEDLNEDVFVYDNHVDAGSYLSHVARFDFTRRAAIVGNTGRFAKVSWWGGGAKVNQGGSPDFLRRVRDVYVTHNILSGANGGVYGNNGDGIYVAYNKISNMTDVGVDFEGCFNAVAEFNEVRNVGNFCYATFYAAKNITFRNNFGAQDGSASKLATTYGKGKYGVMEGRALFAMRSAGFRTSPGTIDVSVLNNHFAWTGATGTGRCIPSFFTRLRIEGNTFENVECAMAYRGTGELHIAGNRLRFDRPALKAFNMLANGAVHGSIVDNEIHVYADQPDGSSAIWDGARSRGHNSEISRNHLISPVSLKGKLPIVVRTTDGTKGVVKVSKNQIDAIYASFPADVLATGNVNRSNQAVSVLPLPSIYQPAVEPDAPKDESNQATGVSPDDSSTDN